MIKVKEYKIVTESNPARLGYEVQDYLCGEGWEPLGAPFIFNDLVCQTLIKKEQ